MPDPLAVRVTVYEASDGWHWRALDRVDVIADEDQKQGVSLADAVADVEARYPDAAVNVVDPPDADEVVERPIAPTV